MRFFSNFADGYDPGHVGMRLTDYQDQPNSATPMRNRNMHRRRLIPLVSLCVACCSLPPLTAFAGDSPLEGIPETAEVLVRLKTPDATVKKVADFAGRLKDEYRKFIMDGAGALGSVINNPGQVGVDRKRDWWLIIIGESGQTAG